MMVARQILFALDDLLTSRTLEFTFGAILFMRFDSVTCAPLHFAPGTLHLYLCTLDGIMLLECGVRDLSLEAELALKLKSGESSKV